VKISAVIIALNEEKNIAAALESVEWADEILLIDSGSTDKTREIAADLKAKVISQEWLGFSVQKQFATDAAQNDWIFSLDADERVSPELKREILQLKNLTPDKLAAGYRIPRQTFYMNRAIRHGGWYPDWQLRFFNRQKGSWKIVPVHESVQLNPGEKFRKLENHILHYTVENAAHHHRMIGERYALLSARQMFENGRLTSPLKIATAGFAAFFKTYLLRAGFLDGLPGFCIARFAAHHAFLKHLMLWEMQNEEPARRQQP
jgi:glycosyltransferase involved in cell wall biosynthesis